MFELLVSLLIFVFSLGPAINYVNFESEKTTQPNEEIVSDQNIPSANSVAETVGEYDSEPPEQNPSKSKKNKSQELDTQKSVVLNIQSEKTTETITNIALEKSPVLITPTQPSVPEVTKTPPGKVTDLPISPEPPVDSCGCPQESGQYCLMVVCPEVM